MEHVLFSQACERNREPILAVLRTWLPAGARVLEIGSGSGQHAVFFCRELEGLHWQPTDQAEQLGDLAERITAERLDGAGRSTLAAGATLADPLALGVDRSEQWPAPAFEAVFSANTAHILAAASVERLLAGAARVLGPGGLLLLYGPFHHGGVHTAPSNAAFDAALRRRDPAMGVRDALELQELGPGLGLEPAADLAMPAHNRTLIFRRRGDQQS